MDLSSYDWTGEVKVEKSFKRSVATRLYGRYPLKFILPSKVALCGVDAVWVFAVTYGGGIVSGDLIACKIGVEDDCILALTTQASTKIFKAISGKSAEQVLKATVGKNAVLVVVPDPVTCFACSRYKQNQEFLLAENSNLILVDWLTSGRRDRGEVWSFDSYTSRNHVYVEGEPIFLDAMKLEEDSYQTIATRLQGFHVVGMLLIYGPRFAALRKKITEKMKLEALRKKFKKNVVCSCSSFGPSEWGLIVRILADSTEFVYDFLKEQLADVALIIGAEPYYGK